MTDAQLIADLEATFPGVWAKPAVEYGLDSFKEGVWVAGEAPMPDGLPMFSTLCYDLEEFNGYVHSGLESWLKERGFELVCWDADVHFAVPLNGRLFD